MGNYVCGNLYNLELSKLAPNPDQPRKVFSEAEIQVLTDSISKKGLLQPILVKELKDGQIIIVSGERRFRAHQFLERETIPAWFTHGDAEELALVENLVREDLSPIETAEALKKLSDKFGKDANAALAKLIGKAKSTVSEILSLNKLPDDVRDIARGDKRFALRELKKIANKRDDTKKRELFNKYLTKIETATAKKPARARANGPYLHEKKIAAMQEYFTKMTDDDKIEDLSSLREQLITLKDGIETILNNLSVLDSNSDAPNMAASPKPKKAKVVIKVDDKLVE